MLSRRKEGAKLQESGSRINRIDSGRAVDSGDSVCPSPGMLLCLFRLITGLSAGGLENVLSRLQPRGGKVELIQLEFAQDMGYDAWRVSIPRPVP